MLDRLVGTADYIGAILAFPLYFVFGLGFYHFVFCFLAICLLVRPSIVFKEMKEATLLKEIKRMVTTRSEWLSLILWAFCAVYLADRVSLITSEDWISNPAEAMYNFWLILLYDLNDFRWDTVRMIGFFMKLLRYFFEYVFCGGDDVSKRLDDYLADRRPSFLEILDIISNKKK
jgi:hypothetical protein